MINETVTIIILYMLMCMTGMFVFDPNQKDQIAWTMIILTLCNFIVNLVPIFVDIGIVFKLKCTRCMKRRAARALKKKKEEEAKQAALDA